MRERIKTDYTIMRELARTAAKQLAMLLSLTKSGEQPTPAEEAAVRAIIKELQKQE